MRTTARKNNYSKEEYLYFLTNKLGYNVEIAHNYTDEKGERRWSKWASYLQLSEYEQEEYIPELHATRKDFLNKATHRSVLDIELLLDIDDAGSYPSIKDKAIKICALLEQHRIEYTVSFSGSKSYHISILLPWLRWYDQNSVTAIKKALIARFDSDLAKASPRNMIALEAEEHWKTGHQKTEVFL